MTIDLTLPLSSYETVSLEHAILETLAYSDVFDYPLRLNELHRYLPISVSLAELHLALDAADKRIGTKNGYFYLAGREALVELRQERNSVSRGAFERAVLCGRILGRLPFIRMVGLTGSLAVLNCDETADLDYMLVAAHGRVWTARAFALLFGRATARFGYTLCPNLVISDQALAWTQQDLYAAHELCQMIPISGLEAYSRLRQANAWTNSILPNATGAPSGSVHMTGPSRVQVFLELPLHSFPGDRFETWELKRKIERLTRQAGFGAETTFSSDLCQGNFNHHGAWTRAMFRRRLDELRLDRFP